MRQLQPMNWTADDGGSHDPDNPQTGGMGWDPTTPAGKKLREEVRLENERNAAREAGK